MKRFFKDFGKYYKYAAYSGKSILKSEVANSYLNWMWWILDPICFMLIYTFIFGVVFDASEQYFPIFIFIGLTMWDFFNKTVVQSVKLVRSNKPIVSKVYLPKYVLILVRMYVNGFKMLISFGIVILMMLVARVPVSLNLLYAFPVLLVLMVFTFAVCTFLLHFGVFVEDLSNVTNIILRLMFYLTGIFYNVQTRLRGYEPYNEYLAKLNPLAFLLTSMRQALIYDQTPDWRILLAWLVVGIVIAGIGVRMIYKNENSYVKVI